MGDASAPGLWGRSPQRCFPLLQTSLPAGAESVSFRYETFCFLFLVSPPKQSMLRVPQPFRLRPLALSLWPLAVSYWSFAFSRGSNFFITASTFTGAGRIGL